MGPHADDAHAPAGDLAHCVLVGGNGAVGRLFAGALAAVAREIAIADVAADPHPDVPALGPYHALDARQPSPALGAALAGADCVVLALPEAAALDALPHVLAALPAGALLVDTLSVKTPFAQAALAAAAPVELLSLNPMFAPSLGFAGHAVLAVELAPGPRSRTLLALLHASARVVTVADAEAHDRATAALQVATHAGVLGFGLALEQLGVDLDELLPVAPPPFLAQLALLARIASASPETYADIQHANPFAAEARGALAAALAQLDDAALDADPERIEQLVAQAGELLGPHREALAEQAAALLAQLEPPPAS
ncbi:MAG: prephenate dehydrogenase dimerization domain-containing protein [Conexibacter sp.]